MTPRQVNAYRNSFTFAIGKDIICNGESIRSHYLLCTDNLEAAFQMLPGDTKELEFVSPNYSVKEHMRYTQIVTRIR